DNVVTTPYKHSRTGVAAPRRVERRVSGRRPRGRRRSGGISRPPPFCSDFPPQLTAGSMTSIKTRWSQFGVLVTVFFFWGFVAASNDILIPVFKNAFHLTQLQSMYVAFAFYVAYTVGSLIYFGVSRMTGGDVLNRIGYKNGICLGLLISAAGSLLFFPAANTGSFTLMLSGLFIVALGFSLQQIAANPLAIVMGNPATGAQRPTLVGGNSEASIESVKVPYLALGAAFVLVALFLKFSSVPNRIDLDGVARDEAEDASRLVKQKSAFAYPQLTLGMLAIFLYVGVEVSTIANLPAYLEEDLGIPTSQLAPYVSLYWASLMIGRWAGAAGAFEVGLNARRMLTVLLPYVAFGVFLAVNAIARHDVTQFFGYAAVIVLMIVATFASCGNPARMLLIFSVCGAAALLLGMATTGTASIVAFVSVGLFCSTMWPCIFALSITGLGRNTNQGSSLLIMMIMGGGLVSLFQGWLADVTTVHMSFIVGVACFAYLAFYAARTPGILRRQGIDLDKLTAGGG